MPKAGVLVTVTAEALIDVPAGVDDVEAYCREHLALTWGGLHVDGLVQPPAVTVEHYILPEHEPEPEPVEAAPPDVVAAVGAQLSPDDTRPLPAIDFEQPAVEAVDFNLVELFNDPLYKNVIRSAVRERAERLLEEVVNQVVAELEPLLQRHLKKDLHGAQ